MRKILITLIPILVLLLFPQLMYAQQFTLNGNGARAAGMGYAFTGVADDATAISWNAAGLTQLYSMEASVIGRLGFGSLNTNYTLGTYEIERGSSFQLNFASLVIPFSAGDFNIVAGVAYRNIYDFAINNEYNINHPFFTTRDATEEGVGGINAVTPAIAFQLNEMISFGAAVNFLMGDYEYDWSDSDDENYDLSVDYSGMIIDLSVLLKPNPLISIGGSLSLPNTVTFEGMDSDDDEWTTDMDVPLFFAVGAAIRASDNFTIAADYRSRPWSDREISSYILNDIDRTDDPDYTFAVYPDANSFHVGLEYLVEAGNSVLPIRLGFYTLPTTSREEAAPGQEDEDADQISYNVVTAGLGIIMDQIILDGSFEYIFGSYVGDYEINNLIDYDFADFRITIGATLHFGN